MNRLSLPLSLILSLVGAISGVGALILYFHAIPSRSRLGGAEVSLLYDHLSLHLWFLEMILVIVALVLAILGLVGYQEMKNLARQAAVQTARDEIRSHPAATAPASRRAVSGNPVGDPSDRKRVPS